MGGLIGGCPQEDEVWRRESHGSDGAEVRGVGACVGRALDERVVGPPQSSFGNQQFSL